MFKISLVLLALGFSFLGIDGVQEAEKKSPEAAPKASPLDRFKALAGDWYALGEDGKPGDRISNSFRVTAGGSAVIETIFPGQPEEMITLYFMEGKKLVLTHYCMMGNQPHMDAEIDATKDIVRFKCSGGTNFACATDAHMHEGVYEFTGKDSFKTKWSAVEGGKTNHEVALTLVRQAPKAK